MSFSSEVKAELAKNISNARHCRIAELSGMRFGVEIETIGISRKDTVSAILTVVGGEVKHEGGSYDKWSCAAPDGRKWNAVSDASIGRWNAEVVSPILTPFQ